MCQLFHGRKQRFFWFDSHGVFFKFNGCHQSLAVLAPINNVHFCVYVGICFDVKIVILPRPPGFGQTPLQTSTCSLKFVTTWTVRVERAPTAHALEDNQLQVFFYPYMLSLNLSVFAVNIPVLLYSVVAPQSNLIVCE